MKTGIDRLLAMVVHGFTLGAQAHVTIRLRDDTPLVIVDFHAEVTSEKIALAWHLDGRVTLLVGTQAGEDAHAFGVGLLAQAFDDRQPRHLGDMARMHRALAGRLRQTRPRRNVDFPLG